MTRHVTTTELRSLFSPDVVESFTQFVDERIESALAEFTVGGGSPWLKLAEAAERLRVSERTVARLVERGLLRTTRIGRRRLVHREDLDALLKR